MNQAILPRESSSKTVHHLPLIIPRVVYNASELDLKSGAPRPGFEPGSKAPEASRMSTTLPRQL